MEDIKKKIEEQAKKIVEEKEKTSVLVPTVPVESKSISQVNISDVEFSLDKSKTYEEQAEDVVSAMATAQAVSDKHTVQDITEKKAEELKVKASKKLKDAQTKDIDAETDRQEAERRKYEAVLSTFGITKHLPNWLLKIMVFLFSPVFILLTIIIGIPCGVVKVLIDNIDNILVRYETAKSEGKPKIKVTIWIILIASLLVGISIFVLKILNKI
jgi:hypothetical protein